MLLLPQSLAATSAAFLIFRDLDGGHPQNFALGDRAIGVRKLHAILMGMGRSPLQQKFNCRDPALPRNRFLARCDRGDFTHCGCLGPYACILFQLYSAHFIRNAALDGRVISKWKRQRNIASLRRNAIAWQAKTDGERKTLEEMAKAWRKFRKKEVPRTLCP